MGLNSNHIFEELGEVKCSVVEKNCSVMRVEFLKKLLVFNDFTVVVVNSPPPKSAAKPSVTEQEDTTAKAAALPETFVIGVTDLSFNTFNAIYNRELLTEDGKTVTPDYWKQSNLNSHEDSWYWKK